ncbi:MAG: cation transporter [Clostridiales bacterium]|nr:cation transporter [Clostridiales bacterium]
MLANIIVILIVAVILVFAVRESRKHFRGESACCGGSGRAEIPVKKLEGKKIGEKTLRISGMTCDHCVENVTKAINRIDGAAARVSLKKGEAVVSYDREISDAELKKAVEARGYKVEAIHN